MPDRYAAPASREAGVRQHAATETAAGQASAAETLPAETAKAEIAEAAEFAVRQPGKAARAPPGLAGRSFR